MGVYLLVENNGVKHDACNHSAPCSERNAEKYEEKSYKKPKLEFQLNTKRKK
jgi:hypothetical protein